ncbi:MAG: desulfoferrodoxin [Candidatus Woesearchaeota archaeon]
MTQKNQVYKCNICGNIVEVLHEGAGQLVCCGQPMQLLPEKTKDQGLEKHVPIIEKAANGFKVRIGSIPHPMEQAHYIEFVEIVADGVIYRASLKPGDTPETEFCVKAKNVWAREYCNLHGLWKSA